MQIIEPPTVGERVRIRATGAVGIVIETSRRHLSADVDLGDGITAEFGWDELEPSLDEEGSWRPCLLGDVASAAMSVVLCARSPHPSSSTPLMSSRDRSRIPGPSSSRGPPRSGRASKRAASRRHLPWAELLRRVHEVDGLRSTRCPGRRRVLAFITDAAVVTAILAHLGLPTQPPPPAPARAPQQVTLPIVHGPDGDALDPPPPSDPA